MKVTRCNGQDVAKISDTSGKGMCKNPEYVEYLQRCIDWRMNNEKYGEIKKYVWICKSRNRKYRNEDWKCF